VAIYKKLEKRGLVVIAMHRGMSSELEVAMIGRSKKWPFSVYNSGMVKGNDQNTNPQCFIFDHTGDLAYDSRFEEGHEKAVVKYAGRAPDWLVGDKKFKKFKSQAKKAMQRKNLGAVLKELEEKAKSGDDAEKEEAGYLVERLKWYAQWRNKKADERIKDGSPSGALDLLKKLAAEFKDHPIGDQADAQYNAKKSDPPFKKELAAEKLKKSIEKMFYSMKPRKDNEETSKWLRRNARYVGQIRKSFDQLKSKYPETMVYQNVVAMVSSLGLG
jgi:hypothetical protein